jgi:hypothetical protein
VQPDSTRLGHPGQYCETPSAVLGSTGCCRKSCAALSAVLGVITSHQEQIKWHLRIVSLLMAAPHKVTGQGPHPMY